MGEPSIVTFNTIISAASRSTDGRGLTAAEHWFRKCEDSGKSPKLNGSGLKTCLNLSREHRFVSAANVGYIVVPRDI